MKEKTGRPMYYPPRARDLWSLSAKGGPLGFCYNGYSPIDFTCASGGNPKQDPALCAPIGMLPGMAGCAFGNNAAEGCQLGSLVANCINGPAFVP